MANVTPMMQQYLTIKEQYKDTILFFRLGDFYEMFYDDAITASRELELTLTGKDCGLSERAPMCGVPFHAADIYISRLIQRGYKVAVCEQLSDPALTKGLVERDVIRIVTPGTIMDMSSLNERVNNFIASIYLSGRRAGISYCDVTTGEFFVLQLTNADTELRSTLLSILPREVISNAKDAVQSIVEISVTEYKASAFQTENSREALFSHFGVGSLTSLGLDASLSLAASAAGALMRYLSETQKNDLKHISAIKVLTRSQTMPIDAGTKRNLELVEGLNTRSIKGSLLGLLDKTATAMGGRQLRSWVEQPLLSKDLILERLDAVDALYKNHVLSETLYENLKNVYDMERLLSRVSYRTLTARDCLALVRSLKQVPGILALLADLESQAVQKIAIRLNPLYDLTGLLERAIHPDAPLSLADGGIIADHYSEQLDELRSASTQGRQWILDLETREREDSGIKNLRIQYNRVFGFYIEVTKSNYAMVPSRYQRRQTLANAERYTTDELRAIENKVTGSQEQSLRLEIELFNAIRDIISDNMSKLQDTAAALKELDADVSLARAAREYNYVRPDITEDGCLQIRDGRHPVVERMLPDHAFVPNDTLMDNDSKRMQIITGPNMAGKSTYMRQVALIVLMAHIGCFVPARYAAIPLVDNIFTRVGASDDLAGGQSTFMVEMSEMAYILRNATAHSLVILDEIGRGTSTFDGLSIAWATVEYVCNKQKCGAKTLFATHYHELSELEGNLEGVENHCVAVKEHGEEVIFLRKIIPGGADKSFGTYVARLAGIPRPVVARAQEIQARLEISHINQNSIGKNILEEGSRRKGRQVELAHYPHTELVEEISKLDVLAMTPMEALNTLFLLREKARKI